MMKDPMNYAKYDGEDQQPISQFPADAIAPDQLNIGKKKKKVKKVKKKQTVVYNEEEQPEVGDETEETDLEEAARLAAVKEDFRKREIALKEAAQKVKE